jgi:hypothetical protein
MVNWTRDEHLTFDIAFALKKVTVPGFRKAYGRGSHCHCDNDFGAPKALPLKAFKAPVSRASSLCATRRSRPLRRAVP